MGSTFVVGGDEGIVYNETIGIQMYHYIFIIILMLIITGIVIIVIIVKNKNARNKTNNPEYKADNLFCPKCGNKLREGALFCGKCGEKR
ncbi:MAG: zinc ribbon domain-containing protein [Treponema sp.]|nr:zinc ribbon domain-containing protein [Treponema sp.]